MHIVLDQLSGNCSGYFFGCSILTRNPNRVQTWLIKVNGL